MTEWPASAIATVPELETAPQTKSVRFPGRPRLVAVSSHERRLLHDGWQCVGVPPEATGDPGRLGQIQGWQQAVVPGTVAAAFRASGSLDLDHTPGFDSLDWWYRCRVATSPSPHLRVLCLDGLATLAEVWLNGTLLLRSGNMFLQHEVDVTALLRDDNELVIRFASLQQALAERRARPRWRTPGVEHQQLRWHRTTLIGRMSGWSPPVKAVGPWRSIRLETRAICDVTDGDVHAEARAVGGSVDVSLMTRPLDGASLTSAMLCVGNERCILDIEDGPDGHSLLAGTLLMPTAEHWWPHTHGEQPRYDARVMLDTSDGPVEIRLGAIAFRRVTVHRPDNGFALRVNGVPVFCRGSCWTTTDVVTLAGSEDAYRNLLTLARDAGMNMMRISGTMVYEADRFYDLCDELGILVWQDFMFAAMDYPTGDPGFLATLADEVHVVLARLRRHPSLALLCGNSEVEQQAAMLGLGVEQWINPFFHHELPVLCDASAPGIPYWPGSPSGGALPFHVDTGVSHYYGIGAYLRPVDDARRSNVKFAAECLGFGHVPDQLALDELLPNGEAPFHHPRWKARVPRDQGRGWDQDDVRDHYLKALFGLDPLQLRYSDMERYVALSRIVTGEMMSSAIREFRRGGSSCCGALTWFFQDMWLGAGFGLIDSNGRPKPAYYAIKRAMQPVTVSITDEGANGLHVHLVNDRSQAIAGVLTLTLLRGAATIVATATAPVRVEARQSARVVADAMLGRFHDTSYAYRFGPPGHDVAVATLRGGDGSVICETHAFANGLPSQRCDDVPLVVEAWTIAERVVGIRLFAERFTPWVALELGSFVPLDNYFHMGPKTERLIHARSRSGEKFDGHVQPLNAYTGVRIPFRPHLPGSDGGSA